MKNNYGKMHKQGFNQWRLQNKLRGRNTSAMQDLQTYLPQKSTSLDWLCSQSRGSVLDGMRGRVRLYFLLETNKVEALLGCTPDSW